MNQKFAVQASHFQIGLWDSEDKSSYPEFPDNFIMEDLVFFGAKGVVVTTEGFENIKIHLVSKDEAKNVTEGTLFLGKGVIQIGTKGFEIGNIIAISIKKIGWKSGLLEIEVYADEFIQFPISIIFILGEIESKD